MVKKNRFLFCCSHLWLVFQQSITPMLIQIIYVVIDARDTGFAIRISYLACFWLHSVCSIHSRLFSTGVNLSLSRHYYCLQLCQAYTFGHANSGICETIFVHYKFHQSNLIDTCIGFDWFPILAEGIFVAMAFVTIPANYFLISVIFISSFYWVV